MMKTAIAIVALLLALLAAARVGAQNGGDKSTPYFQSYAFNVPILDGWEDQSADGIAQFYLAGARATIRTATVATSDAIAAAEADLAAFTGAPIPAPAYSGKVNLADGTWHALVYDIDEATTASALARLAAGRAVVISLIERDPAARTALLAMARADDAQEDAGAEIVLAIDAIGETMPSFLAQRENIVLPSGEWVVYSGEGAAAMGMVFGNDSFVAVREGEPGELATLADAWNRTLLGFFITPDNSRYLALGLAVAFVILGTLIGSLYWRERNLRKDLALLEQLAREAD